MKTSKLICAAIFYILVFQNYSHSQKIQHIISDKINFISESKIFINNNTKARYSDLITLKFNRQILFTGKGKSSFKLSEIKNTRITTLLKKIEKIYGKFKIIKLIPSAEWGDTITTNKRTGRKMSIPDWSQVCQLKFQNPGPIDSIIAELRSSPQIEYAEEPFSCYNTIEPNDTKYIYGNKWAFDNICAKDAWNITKGSPSVIIAIHDTFKDSVNFYLHEDLIDKVDLYYHKYGHNTLNHGICVAGIAGASTNNGIGTASLGWDLRLQLYDNTLGIPAILEAIKNGADVINFSWFSKVDLNVERDAIKTALANGVVCVATAGNDEYEPPFKVYPAAYNFEELGQVIAVSATELVGNEERFVDGWNFSPGEDLQSDLENAFVDISAPGRNIETLSGDNCNDYLTACGTSLSTPFVSALVGLMLSIDSTLTVHEVYEIITSTADKIGQYQYNENGWNRYLGYGRINAYKALLKVINISNIDGPNVENISDNFILYQNYPNPLNPSTTIKYQIPSKVKSEPLNGGTSNVGSDFSLTNVTLKVYDILGREVATLVNQKQKPGNYEVEFDGTNLTSGIYFYKLQVYPARGVAGDFSSTKKMLLLK